MTMTSAERQRFTYDFVCKAGDPGNTGYIALSIEAAHRTSAGTPIEGFTVDQIRKLFWAEHDEVCRAVRRNRGRAA